MPRCTRIPYEYTASDTVASTKSCYQIETFPATGVAEITAGDLVRLCFEVSGCEGNHRVAKGRNGVQEEQMSVYSDSVGEHASERSGDYA